MLNQVKNSSNKEIITEKLPSVTIIVPFYNEEMILEDTIKTLVDYVQTQNQKYDFDILFVDDGSRDESTKIVTEFKKVHPFIHLVSHSKNLGLGNALQTGFTNSTGDYVIVLDADLSYSPNHIGELLEKLITTKTNVVVASPYMKGGKVSNIPWIRYKLSKWANIFLSFLSNSPVKTLTGMVRGYDGIFIRNLSLRSSGSEINPEIIYKASILHQKIEEIPAHLCWLGDDTEKRSKLKIFRHTSNTILVGFLTKPFLFFIFPGLLVLILAIYSNVWMFIHIHEEYAKLQGFSFLSGITEAFKIAYNIQPHTFLISFLSSMLSIQLISTGLQSLQAKYYFEELFSLGTKILQKREKK